MLYYKETLNFGNAVKPSWFKTILVAGTVVFCQSFTFQSEKLAEVTESSISNIIPNAQLVLNEGEKSDPLENYLNKNPEFKSYMENSYFRNGLIKMFKIESGPSNYSDKNLVYASYHGREKFLTTGAGITQIALDQYKNQKGLPQKPLSDITQEETYAIINEVFLQNSSLYNKVHPALMIQQLQIEYNSPYLGDKIAKEFLRYLEYNVLDPLDENNLETLSNVLANIQKAVYQESEGIDPRNLPGLINRIEEFRI